MKRRSFLSATIALLGVGPTRTQGDLDGRNRGRLIPSLRGRGERLGGNAARGGRRAGAPVTNDEVSLEEDRDGQDRIESCPARSSDEHRQGLAAGQPEQQEILQGFATEDFQDERPELAALGNLSGFLSFPQHRGK